MNEAQVKQMIAGCCRGDLQAQHRLYQQYKSGLFQICLRYARDRPEAQDMLQDAFCNIFRDIHQFKGDGHLEGWLRKVTMRAALQHLRRKNPLRFAEEYNGLSSENHQVMPDTELTSEAILQMIQQLPDGYRTVFNMHCMEAFSYPEIAAELGIRESSVRSQYARARKLLQQMVEQYLSCIL